MFPALALVCAVAQPSAVNSTGQVVVNAQGQLEMRSEAGIVLAGRVVIKGPAADAEVDVAAAIDGNSAQIEEHTTQIETTNAAVDRSSEKIVGAEEGWARRAAAATAWG